MSAFDLAADHDSLSLADQARANPLDLSQPVVDQLAAEEAAYSRALIPGQRHG